MRQGTWSRAVTTRSLLGRLGPDCLYSGQQRLFGQGRASEGALGLKVYTPRSALGNQTRSFKKANYIERISDSENAEDLLDPMEGRQDEQNASPQRQALDENDKKQSTKGDNDLLAEHMTKGRPLLSRSLNEQALMTDDDPL